MFDGMAENLKLTEVQQAPMGPETDREVEDLQQQQMLKIISKGFYKELINFGVKEKDIVSVSTHLLDCLIKDKKIQKGSNQFYNDLFRVSDIKDNWATEKKLSIEDVEISPLRPELYNQVANWLSQPGIKYNFIPALPDTESDLKKYLEYHGRTYFGIYYCEKPVGIIGADSLDHESKKLEMKKLVGELNSQGKGIGKHATFVFLYYVFCILNFNKVFIHSGNANIRNINLNSKFGFELEGLFLDDSLINSTWHNIVRMGLLKSRWMEIFADS